MSGKTSANPHRLIAGAGDADNRNNNITNPKHNQIWFLTGSHGNVQDITKYNKDTASWDSILDQFVKNVSGITPDDSGEIDQVILVDGPAPSANGQENQVGIDYNRNEIFWYKNSSWRLIASLDAAIGPTRTHSLDPSTDQISDPTSAPDVAETGNTGNVDAGDHKYLITYISDWGHTTPGPASNVVSVTYGEVELTSVPTSSNSAVDSRNIYRSKAGGDVFYYLDNLGDNSTTSYIDSTADSNLGEQAPSENTTEAHSGSLPEEYVSFDTSTGHNHNGSNSNLAIVDDHDVDPTAGPHTGQFPWGKLENVPSSFAPSNHDVNPGEGPHTGGLPWSQLENIPNLADDPHDNTQHSTDYAEIGHGNEDHGPTFITSATERDQYPASQMGSMKQVQELRAPIYVHHDCQIVELVAMAHTAPGADVSATIYASDDTHGNNYFSEIITLPGGSNMIKSTASAGGTIYQGSILSFSLNDSDDTGESFAMTLVTEYEAGS